MTPTKLSNLFITGCDRHTLWMRPWFQENFRKHNPDANLHVYDFSSEFRNSKGWFKKPDAMIDAAKKAYQICWIDIDCEVLGDLSDIFSYIRPNKLSMVVDRPWTERSGQTWHNSGIVAFEGVPPILQSWKGACVRTSLRGDQEVLHNLMSNPLARMTHIEDIPNQYNVLRLQHIDNTVPENPLVYHWTGEKGKNHIRTLIDE